MPVNSATQWSLIVSMIPAISAGFPSPAADFIDAEIDLSRELVRNPSTTFFGKVRGNSMTDAGIDDGDILIVDKSVETSDGRIAVCFVDGQFTVKRLKIEKDVVWLVAENDKYPPIKVTSGQELTIWGIVTSVIKFM